MITEMSIEIIRKCPNNCIHCSSESTIISSELLPYSVVTDSINALSKSGLESVVLSGGEPVLHPDIKNIVDYVAGKSLKLIIYTSGITLNDNGERSALDSDMLLFFRDRVNKLVFNIQTSDPNTYDSIMGTKGCFSLLKNSINLAKRTGLKMDAHFVPMQLNYKQIEDTIAFCQENGFEQISILGFFAHGRAKKNKSILQLTSEQLDVLYDQIETLKTVYSIPIRMGLSARNDSSMICGASLNKVVIKYDGLVFPCETLKNIHSHYQNHQTDSLFTNRIESQCNSAYFTMIRSQLENFNKHNSGSCFGRHLMYNNNEGDTGCD